MQPRLPLPVATEDTHAQDDDTARIEECAEELKEELDDKAISDEGKEAEGQPEQSNSSSAPLPKRGALASNQNPNFVQDYFAASRLHFIGSFRARYESMMCRVAANLNVPVSQLLQTRPSRADIGTPRIVHCDMDSFFCSVARAQDVNLRGKPIAVCHASDSDSSGGGEISSCSYEARDLGVRAGMFFHQAKKLCPDLIPVPYDFDNYERASIAMYTRFFSIPGAVVEALSVDEAFLLVDGNCDVDSLVTDLRNGILKDTGCTASAGIGPNKLCARVATSKAKPNGQYRVDERDVSDFMRDLQVRDIPGVGWRTRHKLEEEWKITTCSQLAALPLSALQREFGEKQGRLFHDASRGLDSRRVEPMKPRKSIGAEISWGVRFTSSEEDGVKCKKFISDLAAEVASRVLDAGAVGSKVLYKGYRSKQISGKMKYLGHGPCEVLTKTTRILEQVTKENLSSLLAATCLRIHADVGIPNALLRGVGIQVTDLVFEQFGTVSELIAGNRTQSGNTRIDGFLKRRSESSSSLFEKSSLAWAIAPQPKRRRPEMMTPIKTNGNTVELPADWDKSVWDALPEDVRKELIAERRRTTTTSGGKSRQGRIRFGRKPPPSRSNGTSNNGNQGSVPSGGETGNVETQDELRH